MHDEQEDAPEFDRPGEKSEIIRGPHAWLNWFAERAGQPRRTEAHPETSVINPIWEEFALYTDAPIDHGRRWLQLGPYELVAPDPTARAQFGVARKGLILRASDHLSDAPPPPGTLSLGDDVDYYIGGDIGDELAALLSLATGRRVRSGGSVRLGLPGADPLGLAIESNHHAPALVPPRRAAMIPSLGGPLDLADAEPLLSTYPRLASLDAVALVRAARQYSDALWLSDGDPEIAWVKLVGALEAVAVRYDDVREETDLLQLKRHRLKLYRLLMDKAPEIAEEVASHLASQFNIERKVQRFIKEFVPGPPQPRPAAAYAVDWDKLSEVVTTIYDHRSRNLHDGTPFPPPLCGPPESADGKLPFEHPWGLGMMGSGGKWTADRLPMYLHVFAHLTGGAVRNWWTSVASRRDV